MKRIDLQRLRKDKGKSQMDLAQLLGTSQSFVSQVENGKDNMPDYWKQILMDKLDISDISEYQIDLPDPQATFYNNQDNASVYNDIGRFVDFIQNQNNLFRDIIKEKDVQIGELIAVIKQMQNK